MRNIEWCVHVLVLVIYLSLKYLFEHEEIVSLLVQGVSLLIQDLFHFLINF